MTTDASIPDRPPDSARIALGFGLAMGLLSAWGFARGGSELFMLNLEVYYYAADAVLDGRAADLYAVAPPDHPIYRFVYPPAVVAVFLPYGLASSPTVPFVVHTVGQVAAGLALAWVLVRETERHGVALGRVDRALVAGFVLGSIHTVPSLYYGNVNLSLSLLVAVGLAYAGRRPRVAGVALAVPVGMKAFPAAFGAWWLRDRAWRPALVAAGTGVVAALASLAVFGVDLHRTYVRSALFDRLDPSLYEGGMAPGAEVVTVRRPLSILLPSAPSWAITVGAALVLAPVVVAAYTRIEDRIDRLVAVYVTVTAALLFFPSYFVYLVYLYYPLVPLLYLLEGRTGQVFAAGATVTAIAFAPESTMEYLAVLPGTVTTVIRPAVEFASLSLVGLAITLAACLHHRFDRSSGHSPDGDGSVESSDGSAGGSDGSAESTDGSTERGD